jgi:hypothetical protein
VTAGAGEVNVRRLILYSLIAIALLGTLAFAVFIFQDRSKAPIRTGSPPRNIDAVAGQDIEHVNAGIRRIFAAARADRSSSKFGEFDLHPAIDPIFPDDVQLQLASAKNKALADYVAIDPAARSADLYLTPPPIGPPDSSGNTDYYWTSEYEYEGQPVKFKCNFIIHLEPQSTGATLISILEHQPEIWIGRKFDLLGHAGPALYRDIRLVEPTNRDRAELLDFITQKLPGTGN